ncbi:uncharacterized protein LOC120375195 isoform X1 [Mauremys reevesii]|uniref:uncharacterized protein LOC120375195 isoform X1 n=1 Tax=Mauremys reevesii TaxID=260615 RepID=UPI00194015A7|nr:uncharacterized protein LOC120375195 isoform X1 [Mauremys reevesii]
MDWEQFGAARRSQSISLWLWHFCFSAVLGKGWFRKVFLVEYRPLRKMVTLKTMEKSELRDGDLTERRWFQDTTNSICSTPEPLLQRSSEGSQTPGLWTGGVLE